jgi:hypothetical protein
MKAKPKKNEKDCFFLSQGLTKRGACDKWDNEGRYEFLSIVRTKGEV